MKTAKKVAVKKIAKKPVAIKKQQQKNKGKVTKIVTTVVTTTQTTSNNKPTKKKTTIVKSVAAPKKVATPIKAALPLPKTSTSNGNNNNINVPSQTTDDVKIVKAVSKGGAIVDLNVPGHSEYHVVPDTKNQFNGKFFDATLNCSDLGQNNNKFYIIQVIAKDSNPNQCYLWNRWGRVGVVGQNAFSAALSQDQAVNLFMSKYRSKTSSKYTQIEIDYSNKDEEKKVTKKEEKKTVKESKLPQKVQDFINLIYNLNMMKNSMMEVGYDANKMPLGKLGPKTLKEGYNVLKAIETELRGKKNPTVLSNLSSDFYTLIPHNFGFYKMSNFIINDEKMLKEKIDMIEALGNIEIATNIIKEVEGKDDILDQHYQKLNCKIDYIPEKSDTYKLIKSYLDNTAGDNFSRSNVELEDVYEVKRNGDEERFTDFGNKMLLWHGSGINNFVGILSQGMRIAPPEAPSTGYNFGKGVYFADMAAKSLNYCRCNNGTGLILLCEVTVGNPKQYMTTCYEASNVPKGFHSTQGCGVLAPPESCYYDFNGVIVPNGKGEKTSYKTYLGFNEFIVYDVKQVKLRYVLRFKQKNLF